MFYSVIFMTLIVLNIKLHHVNTNEVVNNLLNLMSVEDKCGQMTQITFDVIGKKVTDSDNDVPIDLDKLKKYLKEYKVGSILNSPGSDKVDGQPMAVLACMWQKIIRLIHDVTRNETKLKIPIIYGIDSIHGANFVQEAVLFPQPINLGATFNLEIIERIARITSIETRAVGIPWNFNPILDVGRQPLWSRIFETYSEDTYLTTKMGEAFIKGHQGDNNLQNKENTATCLKHYIGYSYPFNGRDRTPAYIPENMLREVFLPPYEAGVKMGSPTVMINSAEVNGIPGNANSYYINDILKGELKFQGFVVSDWQDIQRLYTRDRVAESEEEAIKIAVMSGLDMSMVPYDASFFHHCVNLSNKDAAFAARVNDAARRILRVKNDLGLLDKNFDNIYPDINDLLKIGTIESEKFNLEAARESIILAKNDDNILPLNKFTQKRIVITGPTANLRKVLNGGWSYTWQGSFESSYNFGREKFTLFQALCQKLNNATYVEGANFTHVTTISQALHEARASDLIILSIGEDAYTETPGSINNLMLSSSQITLANELFKLNKPVLVVYFGGRPRIITDIVKKANAVILGFLPGNRGAEAVADIIFNDYNPNGRLPLTYPLNPNGIITYDYKPIENHDANTPETQILFPFGHGLSYTSFNYSNLKLDKDSLNGGGLTKDTGLKVSVDVKNIGNLPGKETVILYINDEVGSVSRPVKQVRGFKKIHLNPNETRTVNFNLNIMSDLSFIGAKNKRIVESGYFNIYISNLKAKFKLTAITNELDLNKNNNTQAGEVNKPDNQNLANKSCALSLNSINLLVFFTFYYSTIFKFQLIKM